EAAAKPHRRAHEASYVGHVVDEHDADPHVLQSRHQPLTARSRSPARGSESTKRPPGETSPGGSYHASPPCARASSRTMNNPSPVPPCDSPVANRSNNRDRIPAGTPAPASLTAISTWSSTASTVTATGEAPWRTALPMRLSSA